MVVLILGVNTLYRLFCFFKLFSMVGNGVPLYTLSPLAFSQEHTANLLFLLLSSLSQAWHDLALYGHNWQHVDLFEFQVAIEGTVVERMSKQCGGFLRTLSLRDCEHVEDDALR